METIEASVVEAKKRFSEFLNRSAFSECRVVITKRNRPVAALVGMSDLHFLQQNKKPKGLLEAVGKWDGFEEIAEEIEDAVRTRHEEKAGRDVSF
ncbi:MAG: type II toxin-antitoxin system Phd/YefM family antitoxin [Thermodesulfobacteriota bacterium]